MNTEDFVTYDQAIRLRGLIFDWPCIAEWAAEPDGNPCLIGSTAFVFRNSECKGQDVCAPTLAQAAKWLRDVKGIHVDPYINCVGKWFVRAINMENNKEQIFNREMYDTYEAAISAGIDAALDIAKE